MKSFDVPKGKRDMQSFLGLTGFFAHLVPEYGKKAALLSSMTRKDIEFDMNEDALVAFESLKGSCTRRYVIGYIDYLKPLKLYTDASNDAFSGVMTQVGEDGRERIMRCFHKKFTWWRIHGI